MGDRLAGRKLTAIRGRRTMAGRTVTFTGTSGRGRRLPKASRRWSIWGGFRSSGQMIATTSKREASLSRLCFFRK